MAPLDPAVCSGPGCRRGMTERRPAAVEVDLPVRRRHPRVRPCALGQESCRAVGGDQRLRPVDAGLAVRPNDWNSNLIVLGDCNLDRIGHLLNEAFIATGLWPPAELNTVPRTTFDDDKTRHFYDQVAWFSNPDGASLLQGLTYGNGPAPLTSSRRLPGPEP